MIVHATRNENMVCSFSAARIRNSLMQVPLLVLYRVLCGESAIATNLQACAACITLQTCTVRHRGKGTGIFETSEGVPSLPYTALGGTLT